MNSKLIGSHKDFFAPLVVDAVMKLDLDQDLNLIGVKKVPGGSMEVRRAGSPPTTALADPCEGLRSC